MTVKEGDTAPDFTLPAHDGKMVSLSELRKGGAVVVFFYPKDHTPGCTAQVCAFRDSHQDFVDAGATVVGISAGDEASHTSFVEKQKLPYTLLCDTDNKVRKAFGVPSSMFGALPGRVTYVIDTEGVVRLVFNSQLKAAKHSKEALAVVRTLTQAATA